MSQLAVRAAISPQAMRRLESGTASVVAVIAVVSALELQLSRMPVGSTIVDQVVGQRKRRDLTISDVANATRLSRMTIRAVEAGGGSMESLDKVVQFLAPAAVGRDPIRASWQRVVGKRGDDQFTPPQFLDAIVRIFGLIDLDPSWHERSPVSAYRTFSLAAGDDGLHLPWQADLVWLNPPYSQLLRWLRKADEEWSAGRAGTIVCLVPARTDSTYFHDCLARIGYVYLLRRRLRFIQLDGRVGNQAPFGLMLILLGSTPQQRLALECEMKGLWVQRPKFEG